MNSSPTLHHEKLGAAMAMPRNTLADDCPDPDPTSYDRVAFESALDAIRNQTVKLMCAICAVRHLTAWLESCELRYALDRAERLAHTLSDPLQAEALRRWTELQVIAVRIQLHAPSPSREAIHQGRSSDWHADRSAWKREEQQWIAFREATGPRYPYAYPPLWPPPSAGLVTMPSLDMPPDAPGASATAGTTPMSGLGGEATPGEAAGSEPQTLGPVSRS